ncbi:MAG: PAS domain-containing protein [Minwuia sp.]|uniref:PAS domain-containing protein n=1 Tax=Minwuia sp. TaxID=2493630 RepID=UPI003A83E16D
MKPDTVILESRNFRRTFLPLPPDPALGPNLLRVWSYWNELKGDLPGPPRNAIDPADLTSCLPGLMLMQPEGTPQRFRHRLAGTAAESVHGRPLTRIYIDEMQPESFARSVHADLTRVVEERTPQLARLSFENREGKPRQFESLRLPLSDDGERIDMILVYVRFRQG